VRFGKPLAFYSDKASIFRVNQHGAIKGPCYTQFGRALFELNTGNYPSVVSSTSIKLAIPTAGIRPPPGKRSGRDVSETPAL
jgi:hypothetical protein